MKKKIFLAIFMAVIMLLGCSKNDIVDVNFDREKIDFSISTKTLSKAKVITPNTFKNFVVNSYLTDNDIDDITLLNNVYMDNLSVSRESISESWSYEGDYYWPVGDKRVQFFCVSPYSEAISEYNVNKFPSFKYHVRDIASQEDLVIASALNKRKSDNSKVNLNFNHILTQINFSVKGEKEDFIYEISKLELLNVKNIGKFSFTDVETLGSWSDKSGNESYIYDYDNFVINGGELKPIQENEGGLMLLPQNNELIKIRVTYLVKDKVNSIVVYRGTKEVVPSYHNWEKGKNIRYILTLPLSGKKVTITSSVDDWENEIDVKKQSLNLDITSASLDLGEKMVLKPVLAVPDESAVFEWVSSDENIAVVDENGNVKAISKGNVDITVKYKDYTDKCAVQVSDAIYFEDENFKSYLLNDLTINTTKDDKITVSEALHVENLNVSTKEITSLVGIEYFKNIKDLFCAQNKLTHLDLSNNILLEKLFCFLNEGITSLDLSNNINLVTLSSDAVKLENLDVSNCTKLTEIYASDNNLINLNLANNVSLKTLVVNNNKLANLNLNENINLENLFCNDNSIVNLDVEKCLSVKNIECNNNKITSIDIHNNSALIDFKCDSNQITNINVSANPNLHTLSCNNNNIGNIDITSCKGLVNFYCNFNSLEVLNLKENTSLMGLLCTDNKLIYLNIKYNNSLQEMNCINNVDLRKVEVWNGFDKTKYPKFTIDSYVSYVVK